MEMWFSELHTSNVKLSMRIEKQLFSGNSDCQRIDVLESVEFGKFLALDGDILFSEKDEFIYDEMVTHVPMAVHPDVRHVLIIGGGDGGVAKELTQYDSIEKIDVVEPDEMLVEVCREHFPELACGLDDPRVNVYYQDGLRFLRNKTEEYDLIINDATDPFGHTEGLFTKEFYGSCYKALKEDGIMVYQHRLQQCAVLASVPRRWLRGCLVASYCEWFRKRVCCLAARMQNLYACEAS